TQLSARSEGKVKMGTSQSSEGPGSNVPMVPAWVPEPSPTDEPEVPGDDDVLASQIAPVAVAPAARFGGARTLLGAFAQGGDRADLRRGLGHYVRTGYGGAATATRRMAGTAATASTLYGALSNLAAGRAVQPGSPADPNLLRERPAADVMDAVVEAVRPIDGTQDAEAARAAIREALADLLTQFPEANLLMLTLDQCAIVVERYTAVDIFRRFQLDVGKAIMDRAPSASAALSRVREAREYIRELVAASFRKLRDAGNIISAGNVTRVVTSALRDTFDVFSAYAE
ncbi:MAG: hypothetical protein JWP08_3024, partial [Bryobacterales bacterium]|nr:hypothetical protein [Bryobacterales bacterium]